MKRKLKSLFTNIRVIILLIFLVLAVVAIHPSSQEGVAIRSVARNSSAEHAGVESPDPASTPMSREVLLSMNGRPIRTENDYYSFVEDLEPNRTIQLKTSEGFYRLETKPDIIRHYLNETETVIRNNTLQVNETIGNNTKLVNKTVQEEVEVQKYEEEVVGTEDLGLEIYPAPSNNIRKGLDLQGGTRVLLQPLEQVSAEDMEMILENMRYRLNIYGLTDVTLTQTKDLSGNNYIMVEIAGANEEEVGELLAKQGKFEAKIGNNTVFLGGTDITHVCRSADCSGIDPYKGCGTDGSQHFCTFRFSIALTPAAAERQAEITKELDVITENNQQYLSQKLDLYLDDEIVDSLNIGADLQGRPVTDIQISGSGGGINREQAVLNSLENMKRLQTVLITGSLPVKLEIVKSDVVSPFLGDEFVDNAILVGVLAIIAVAIVVFIAYRKLQIALPMMFTMASEVTLLLGLAALIGWNLDLAAIAGIIIAAGTGVDHQIVIADEILKGEKNIEASWKQKIKKAFFIIMAAYFTTVVAMVPLLFAGAGLIKGFALTTIVGVSFGVFLTRPAFASIAEILLRK